MKKTYVKPELSFESFELSANIATGCGVITKSFNQEQGCGYDIPGVGKYFADYASCDYDKDNPYVCYDNPNESTLLFTS